MYKLYPFIYTGTHFIGLENQMMFVGINFGSNIFFDFQALEYLSFISIIRVFS